MVGMFPPILTILNRDDSRGTRIPLRTASIRGAHHQLQALNTKP